MRFCAAFLCALSLHLPVSAQRSESSPPNELDDFMKIVLAQREKNRIALQQYVLDETEDVEVLGPGRVPLYGRSGEFTWYVRDGLHVRSPVRINGVGVGEGERTEYELRWARRERERLERRKQQDEAADAAPAVPEAGDEGLMGQTPVPTPRFVSEAYFMEFKFEPGNYYLAGREQLDGQDVLRVEYYPERMFADDDPPEKRKRDKGQEHEDRIMRQMNKTALITLWIDPAHHQIVKYTFDNVWMDFLPGAWLVKVDDIHASMTMGQPFPGVWLPREMRIRGAVTLANGSFDALYERTFSNYKQAEVATKIRIPKPPDAHDGWDDGDAGPHVPETEQAPETVVEIRVHGNAFIPDADVIRLAGVTSGTPLTDAILAEIERRLKDSGRFETVEVRKRYRSLTNSAEVSLLLVVHERPGVTSVEDPVGLLSGSWRRFRSKLMFLPILHYADGYGFTYGARTSTVDLLGFGERLSIPLTWGGTRRAALELERTFEQGPITRVESSFGIRQRENPHYGIADRRIEWKGRAERRFARLVRAGVDATRGTVDFGALDDRLWTLGADAALDTRADPSFPRNAVFLGAGWTGLHARAQDGRVNRYVADARGYVGLIRQSVLAARVQYTSADRPLPQYERLLLGGSSTLRGFRTGTFSGDRLFVTSAELRIPITSILSGARLGVSAFYDAAKAYDAGQRFEGAEWRRSTGAGLFLIASVVRLNLDVAHGFKTGGTRVHLGMGFPF